MSSAEGQTVLPDVGVFTPPDPHAWPNLDQAQIIAITAVNVGALVLCWVLLRIVYPPPTDENIKEFNKMNEEIEEYVDNRRAQYQTFVSAKGKPADVVMTVKPAGAGAGAAADSKADGDHSSERTGLLAGNGHGRTKPQTLLEGESAGDYTAEWTSTFDLTFVIIMALFFVGLCVWTTIELPELWSLPMFWVEQLPKVVLMMFVSCIGGWLCRHYLAIDEKGYIDSSRTREEQERDSALAAAGKAVPLAKVGADGKPLKAKTWFKVNYTRKLQHFAAYLVPLLLHTRAAAAFRGPLTLSWGNFVTLLGFLILIKPLRERSTFLMWQFNSLDRPEDRPNTLSWIVGGNILPGCVLIIFFRWLYSFTDQGDMAYIFIFITGIGDGLAEPVGIYLGKHKYWTASCLGDRRYQRSYEGSACVFLSGLVFCSAFWYTFHSAYQFWTAMIIMPPLMAYVEATSPHTIDTPSLMGIGGLTLWLITRLTVNWH